MCLELVLGVKLNALSDRSGTIGLDDDETIGTVMPRARPLGGVCRSACFFSRGPNRTALGVRRSKVSCFDEGRDDSCARVGAGVSLVGGAELGLEPSILCENSLLDMASTSRMVGILSSDVIELDRPEELGIDMARGRPALTQGRIV
jgi:hypothetical protein